MSPNCENIDVNGKLYGRWMIMPGVWALTNRWQNFQFLLIGNEKAMLIDTGYGEGNIRKEVEEITDKPVIVVNTHGHFDHTGGNGWWDEAYMEKNAVPQAKKPFAPHQAEWFHRLPYQDYTEKILHDGDVIDLGDREIEVIHIPAHNESSIALLDKNKRLLFTGDEIEGGQVLLFARRQNLDKNQAAAAHKNNMLKLKARRSEFDFICPAHNGCMLNPDKYLDDFITLADQILNDTAVPMQNTAGFNFASDLSKANSPFATFGTLERYTYGEASFIVRR